jgi:hypothetical protein
MDEPGVKPMNDPDMMDLILNAHIKAKTMTTPPCRICNQSGPVICYPDDHSQTICPGGRKVAGWERSRNRCGLWVETTRLAYIGKEKGRNRWHWSIDMKPYTCGTADSLTDAKNAVAAKLARIQQEPTHADH